VQIVVEPPKYPERMEEEPGAFPLTIARIGDLAAERGAAAGRFGPPVAVWRHGDERLEGYGVATRRLFAGEDRIAGAGRAWRDLVRRAVIDSDVAGATPIAFGGFAFAADSAAASVLLLPRVVIVQRGDERYRVEAPSLPSAPAAPPPPGPATARFSPEAYERAVAEAVRRIGEGDLEKVVLARDLPIRAAAFDLGAALDALAERYRGSWIFAVDGMFGASPETLATVQQGLATSRVLAGTAPRDDDPVADAANRDELLGSPKNRFEHALAVDSLLLTLGSAVDDLTLGRPFALGLPNVWHLATDATARVRSGVGALDLVALLHPTAAVAGSPRATAQDTIRALEPFDRRRYAGPVGWIDGNGDGEWAIALRSAEVEGPDLVRAYAGAGVVAASDARQELEETRWKFQPIEEALASVASPALVDPAAHA
jgi:menaquinone-specific isochorismate synthase